MFKKSLIDGYISSVFGLAAVLLLNPGAANAQVTFNSIFDVYNLDYTIPADGQKYLWQFFFTSSDPSAELIIGSPNEADDFLFSGPNGSESNDVAGAGYSFQETFSHGVTNIVVEADRSYNKCTAATPSGQICGELPEIFGDSVSMFAAASAPVTWTSWKITAIPEPASWTILLAGFGLAGAALRRKKPIQLA